MNRRYYEVPEWLFDDMMSEVRSPETREEAEKLECWTDLGGLMMIHPEDKKTEPEQNE
jgi:hypothetical protein